MVLAKLWVVDSDLWFCWGLKAALLWQSILRPCNAKFVFFGSLLYWCFCHWHWNFFWIRLLELSSFMTIMFLFDWQQYFLREVMCVCLCWDWRVCFWFGFNSFWQWAFCVKSAVYNLVSDFGNLLGFFKLLKKQIITIV